MISTNDQKDALALRLGRELLVKLSVERPVYCHSGPYKGKWRLTPKLPSVYVTDEELRMIYQ